MTVIELILELAKQAAQGHGHGKVYDSHGNYVVAVSGPEHDGDDEVMLQTRITY